MIYIDTRWIKNPEWWHYEGYERVLNDDAPEEAKESYKNYLIDISRGAR